MSCLRKMSKRHFHSSHSNASFHCFNQCNAVSSRQIDRHFSLNLATFNTSTCQDRDFGTTQWNAMLRCSAARRGVASRVPSHLAAAVPSCGFVTSKASVDCRVQQRISNNLLPLNTPRSRSSTTQRRRSVAWVISRCKEIQVFFVHTLKFPDRWVWEAFSTLRLQLPPTPPWPESNIRGTVQLRNCHRGSD